ncbi:MAG: SUMF1/EgtB/PvdO family nonheme iron enzyme [Microscillaceae bacterium]|nr:SUMF1/EgtB/PvdO family nonheme iron enzyme [Microscillaceae bacterium]
MKYEISQQQYVTFLNLLDFNQQINRTAVAPSSAIGTAALAPISGNNRNSIEISTSGVAFATPAIYGNDLNGNDVFDEATDGGNIACNYLSWEDLKAYLDWAALRPMTELEFEKTCRGPNAPVLAEYAWGTTTINQAISNALTNGGLATEVSTSAADGLSAFNAGVSTVLGPLRVGFAATASTFRTGAGASYYGILDLSGNVWEQAFHCGFVVGPNRVGAPTFTGTLGDGILNANGDANAANWGGVASSIIRGGNWESIAQRARVSDRLINTFTENTNRVSRTGGRGVR